MSEYLFRFDGARENDEFFKSVRDQGVDIAYAGIGMVVGPGWIPDFLMVSCDEAKGHCILKLIELESKKSDALISSRKYLPESSTKILNAFQSYLKRVSVQCSSTADPRISDVAGLRDLLQNARSIQIQTACALRSDPTYLECLPLLDQPQTGGLVCDHSFKGELLEAARMPSMTFEGRGTLSRNEAICLNRTILILDAIVRRQDHSDADLHAWSDRRRNPLQKAVNDRRADFPEVRRFLATDKNNGAKLSYDALFEELSALWSDAVDKRFSRNAVRNLVREYYPAACKLKKRDRMRDVFDEARPVVEKQIGDESVGLR